MLTPRTRFNSWTALLDSRLTLDHLNEVCKDQRANKVQIILTAMAAVFLPLNLITGYFGMNFAVFHLLHGEDSMLWATLFMLLIAVGLAGFFWRRHYFGGSQRER